MSAPGSHPKRDVRAAAAAAKPPGTSPGTLVIDPAAPPPQLTLFAYGPDEFARVDGATLDSLRAHLHHAPVVWLNIDGLGDRGLLVALGALLDIHRLALEDIVFVRQRAKVEPYEKHLYIVVRMAREREPFRSEQVSFLLGEDYVVTFQEDVGDSFDLVRQRLELGRGAIRASGASYLAYSLLDALVDGYFPVLESLSDRLDAIERRVVVGPDERAVRDLHAVRRDLLAVRRAIWPLREAVGALVREESRFISPPTRLYLRDCHDHVVQLIDIVEVQRELASGLMDLHLSRTSHRLSEIMTVLTIYTAVFIPLTFIAGVYGMNFRDSPWNMPELTWRFGYLAALGVMAAVAAGLLWHFRRRGWIGRRTARRRRQHQRREGRE